MKKFIMLLLLAPLLHCATTIKNLDESALGNPAVKKENGYMFLTIKKDYFDINSARTYYTIFDEANNDHSLYISLDRGKFEKNIYCFELPAGKYRVTRFGISSFRAGEGYLNVNMPFVVKAGAVTYLHHNIIDLTLGGIGGPKSSSLDKYDVDVALFKQKYPKFSSNEFINKVN